jgi:hypothetical protein
MLLTRWRFPQKDWSHAGSACVHLRQRIRVQFLLTPIDQRRQRNAIFQVILRHVHLATLRIQPMGFIKEFTDFAVKGNALDLAVGVILGAAFGKVVNSIATTWVGHWRCEFH